MKAKLFVRGIDPIELEVDEALAAQALIADATKSKDVSFSIEGVWSGKKADMKFVVFPKKEDPAVEAVFEEMNKTDADAFKAEFQPFVEKAKAEGYGAHQNVLLWLESKGAVTLKRFETNGKKHLSHAVIPEAYKASMKRFDAYRAYQEKVAYAKFKEAQELEKMAAQMDSEIAADLPVDTPA